MKLLYGKYSGLLLLILAKVYVEAKWYMVSTNDHSGNDMEAEMGMDYSNSQDSAGTSKHKSFTEVKHERKKSGEAGSQGNGEHGGGSSSEPGGGGKPDENVLPAGAQQPYGGKSTGEAGSQGNGEHGGGSSSEPDGGGKPEENISPAGGQQQDGGKSTGKQKEQLEKVSSGEFDQTEAEFMDLAKKNKTALDPLE